MTYLKKNKLLIFFFIVGIIQILYYSSQRNNFQFEILKSPFKKNSHVNYVLPELVIETKDILISSKIKKFNLSKKLSQENNMYYYQRIIEYNYPSRFDEKSEYTLFLLNEEFSSNCDLVSKGKFIELKKCRKN